MNGIGKNCFFDKCADILLKITAGRLMRTSIEIANCQNRLPATKICSMVVMGSSNNSDNC